MTGTGAGHEPQTKVHRPEEKLSSTVICGLGLDPRADWGQQFGLPPAYHPSLQPATSAGLGEVVSVDGTHDEQESANHHIPHHYSTTLLQIDNTAVVVFSWSPFSPPSSPIIQQEYLK